ncbi:putative heterokaryon incompatibility [Septoria linicola]|nr:putative heterokaryon incompatibility [Septoria linicola]
MGPIDSEAIAHAYVPMKDPQKQIRLLYFLPGGEKDTLQFELSTWYIALSPAYLAISYTWGENKNHKTVYIDGKPRRIWPNAHYALSQIRLHAPGAPVWPTTSADSFGFSLRVAVMCLAACTCSAGARDPLAICAVWDRRAQVGCDDH